MSTKRIGEGLGAVVVGTSFGFLTHMRGLQEAGYTVHALVGRDREKAQDRARRGGVAHGLDSLEEALALPGVDVVTVATPPHTHADIVAKAIAAGKHIVCEKPLARDAAEARSMLEAARSAGVYHTIGTEFRWSTSQALTQRAIREGMIGEPRLATFLLQQPMLASPDAKVPSWWNDADEGGGWLGAYASHTIDQIQTTCGEIEGVSASLRVTADHGPEWTAEDTFSVHFRTRTGCEGIMQSSAGTWGPGVGLTRIAGSQGTVWVEGADVWVGDAKGQRKLDVPRDLVLPAPKPPDREILVTAYDMMHSMGIDLAPFTRLFEALACQIKDLPIPPDPELPSFRDGAMVMAVLDAIRRSSREHAWVEVESID